MIEPANIIIKEIKSIIRLREWNAGTDREYLIGEGERKGLYIKLY